MVSTRVRRQAPPSTNGQRGPTLTAAGRLAVVVGTRPEIIKLAPLVAALGDAAQVTYTGQHYDESLAGTMFDTFGMQRPDEVVAVGGRSRGEQIGQATAELSRSWEIQRPECVVVQGDTNSALAGALAANACGLPLVHLEAGLRSWDRAMPEEHNRVLIDHLAELLLAPTDHAYQLIRAEQITATTVVVGNTIVEAVQAILPPPAERGRLVTARGAEPSRYLLATIHRPENTDDPERLRSILRQLGRLGLPVLFPAHPRTMARIGKFGLLHLLTDIRVLPPLSYREFLGLSAEAALLVSDSGGVQEEASVYKRPLLVVRNSTERPEVLGTFARLIAPGALADEVEACLSDLDERHRWLAQLPSPYGDGDAAARSVDAITHLIEGRGLSWRSTTSRA